MKTALVIVVSMAMALAACGDTPPVSVARAHHRRPSPPQVAPPDWPDDAFDHDAALAQFALARAAGERGDWAAARTESETGLARWPVSIEGWEQLIAACGALKDLDCQRRATFFHAKLLVLDGLPMRTASLSFQTLAENPVGSHAEQVLYDQPTLAMADRLWVFCSKEDPAHSRRPEPTEESFDEAYPYAPALLVIGIGAGLLTGVKSLANK